MFSTLLIFQSNKLCWNWHRVFSWEKIGCRASLGQSLCLSW